MGFWSTNLYGNDTTCYVRDFIIDKLTEGVNLNEILQKIEVFNDEEEEILSFLAIADTLWNYGMLNEELKEKALYYINNNALLDLWDTDSQKRKWILTLQKVKDKIVQQKQGTRKIRELLESIPWNKGDVYAYKCHKSYSKKEGLDGKYIIFQVIGYNDMYKNPTPIIFAYNKIFDSIPSLNELNGMDYMPLYPLNDKSYGKNIGYKFNHYSIDVWGYYKSEYKPKEFCFLFNKKIDFDVEKYYSLLNYLTICQFELYFIYFYCLNKK